MPFQPLLAPKTRRRQVIPEESQQQMVPLEATGTFPSVAGAVVRGLALPTASVTTHPGCAMRMSVTPAFRKCQGFARIKEPARGKCTGCLEKVGAASKHQNKTASKSTLITRQNRLALPQIPKGRDKDYETPGQQLPGLPAYSSSCVKAAPLGNHDMTPWAGPSQSETSFHALFKPMVSFLHTVPFSAAGTPGSCSYFPELGEKAPLAEEERRRTAGLLLQGKAKHKGRSRAGLPSHPRSKWQGMTLPPVPSITNLNFSRNFTFSFFELPPHQSRQCWLRQQLICLLMKQLK